MNRFLLLGWLAAVGGDISTTDYALMTRTQAQGHEALLPTQSPAVVTAIKGGELAFGLWAYHHVKPDHPKLAWVIYGASVGASAFATGWNIHQLRK